MKKLFLFLFFNSAFSILNCAFSQGPLVKKWDHRYGGTEIEYLFSFIETHDGGFMLGGVSYSPQGGDKTDVLRGISDFWVVRLDTAGNKIWDKTFGGDKNDDLYAMIETSDHGFLLGGLSRSSISGEKTEANRDTSLTWADYWIVKIDSNGTKQWDKRFGGMDEENLYALLQTNDGGYLLAGLSNSDAGGDISQPNWGLYYDYWILKTDAMGNKLWDKRYGGTDDDEFSSLAMTADGGFLIGGSSLSGQGGCRTQPTWGSYDYWILKVDSTGAILWDRRYGGTNQELLKDILATPDGNFLLAGTSMSGIGGDKTQPNWNALSDYWILKIDSAGTQLWDKVAGGTDMEEFNTIIATSDGDYLFSGDSYSAASGDKSENNFGLEQSWFFKTDDQGNPKWNKTVLTPGHDEYGMALQTKDGCYAVANYSNGTVGGYKTEPPWNNGWDYWIVKFCDTSAVLPNFTATGSVCPGTCVDFTNLSLNATTYQWSFPGATPDSSTDTNPQNICYPNSGNYDVQLIAANANGSDTLLLTDYISVYSSPPPQAITQNGDTLFAIQGSTSYQWFFNGNIITSATDYFYVGSASGDYNVVATDTNGCEVEAAVFDVVLSIESGDAQDYLYLFPNPVFDKFTIHNAKCKMGTAVEVSVYNMIGEKVNPAVDSRQLTVDCRLLPPGMYILEMHFDSTTFRAKFVKQ